MFVTVPIWVESAITVPRKPGLGSDALADSVFRFRATEKHTYSMYHRLVSRLDHLDK